MNSSSTSKNTFLSENKRISFGIRARLFLGFGAIAIVFLLSMCITFYIVTTTKAYTKQVVAVSLPTYDLFLNLGSQIYESQSALRGYVLSNKPELKVQYEAAFRNIEKLKMSIDSLSNKWTDTSLINNWNEIKTMIADLKSLENEIIDIGTINITDNHFIVLMDKSNSLSDKILVKLDGAIGSDGERIGGAYDKLYSEVSNGTNEVVNDINIIQVTELVLAIVAVIFSILIIFITSKSIVRHINIYRKFSNQIASGDLRHSLDITTRDEIGELGNDLNIMTESLSRITKQITEACHNMVSMLEEVRQAVDVQSSGATEQASSINEITSSLDEIEKCSAQTMEKAKALGGIAEITREKGQQGLQAVEQSIQGMKTIRDKVQTIAQTILDLSNQTQQVGEITTLV